MRKLFLFLCAALMSVGSMMADTTVTWGASEFSSFGVDYLHDASRTVKGITVTVNAANNNFINVTEFGTTFNATIDNAFTFSTELGNITKIECTTLYTKGTLGDGWTIGANSATWEGNTNTLNFGNAGSMLVVSNIVFTFGEPEPEPEPEPATTVVTITDSDFPSEGQSFTKDGVTVSALAIDGMYGDISGPGSFSTTLGNFTKIEVNANYVGIAGEGWSGDSEHKTWTGNAASVSFDGAIYGIGEIVFTIEPASTPEPEPQPAGDEITVTWNNPSGYGFEFTQDGVTLTCGEITYKDFYGPGTFTTDLGNFTKIEVYAEGGCLFSGDGWSGDDNQKTWTGNAASVSFSYDIYVPTSIVFTIEPAATPEPEPDSETLATNTGKASYAGTHFSVTPNAGQEGDSDGFYVTYTEHATISALNGETILSVELTVGAGEEYISYFGASKGNVSHSGSLITISDVNATSVELLMTYMSALQISQVKIYYTEPTPVTDPITPYADPQDASVYYSTFYDHNFKYALPEGVEAYVATRDGANLLLSRIAVAGQTIPADNAVILKSSVDQFTLTVSDADAVPVNAINHLEGSDVSIATPDNCYVLAGTDGVVGFYRYTAANLNAHKAFVIYTPTPGQGNAPKHMPFIFDQATGMDEISQEPRANSQKLIENGVLYIIRDGKKYNAQGQMVK